MVNLRLFKNTNVYYSLSIFLIYTLNIYSLFIVFFLYIYEYKFSHNIGLPKNKQVK